MIENADGKSAGKNLLVAEIMIRGNRRLLIAWRLIEGLMGNF